MNKRNPLSVAVSGFMLLACTGLLISCGRADRQVTGPSSDDLAGVSLQKPAASVSDVAAVATEIIEATASAYVRITGKTMPLTLPSYADDDCVAVLFARFTVPPYSMADGEGHQITMKVQSGATLEDVQVIFGPSGLEFAPPATLVLALSGPVAEEDVRQVLHIDGDGSIESVTSTTDVRGVAFLLVTIKVSGFSRYSLGDGDFAEADGPAW